jgi:hypothetical protein
MAQTQPSGCLVALFKLFGAAPAQAEAPEALPYRRKDYLLTKAERSFFGALSQAVGDEYLIFPQIGLGQLLAVRSGTESPMTHLNRISAKRVDFLLCDRDAIRPLLAIELDDSSHARPDRRSRDAFVEAALAAAGLPLLRIPARAGYNLAEVESQIGAAIQSQGGAAPTSVNDDSG